MPVVAHCMLYTFPFVLYVKGDGSALDGKEYRRPSDGLRIRVYVPFRSAPANFIPMPALDPRAIPQPPGLPPVTVPGDPKRRERTIAAHFGVGSGNSVVATWGDELPESLTNLPMDSLRIDVFQEDSDEAQRVADDVMNRLIDGLRYRSRQCWIGRGSVSAGHLRVAVPLVESEVFTPARRFGVEFRPPVGDESPIDEAKSSRVMWCSCSSGTTLAAQAATSSLASLVI